MIQYEKKLLELHEKHKKTIPVMAIIRNEFLAKLERDGFLRFDGGCYQANGKSKPPVYSWTKAGLLAIQLMKQKTHG